MAESTPPDQEILLAHFIVSDDVERSRGSTRKFWVAGWSSPET